VARMIETRSIYDAKQMPTRSAELFDVARISVGKAATPTS